MTFLSAIFFHGEDKRAKEATPPRLTPASARAAPEPGREGRAGAGAKGADQAQRASFATAGGWLREAAKENSGKPFFCFKKSKHMLDDISHDPASRGRPEAAVSAVRPCHSGAQSEANPDWAFFA